ncbi:hypothetical protein [Arthrobacter globiformis]|uniref:Uncharacterized protein n=1 Tax=Arthrobacter globiformis TaxID=1665 RepID=A0A328HJC3_ARTGO|nr:hypothetical protein [Arthrobacter globiformis]RAM38592.1 hypothetical protein DBZ45_03800 [Arthrobacter globiformis]
MKKTALGVLALAGTLVVQLAGAGPSTAGDRVTTKTEMRGEGVTAEFVRTDGCIQTNVSVFGSVFTARGSAPPEKVGYVSVIKINTCTAVTLIDGFGDATTLNLALPNGLSKGRLRMSMEFTNYADAENPVVSQVTADVSFRATAQAVKTSEKSKSLSEGVRFVSSEKTKARPVSAAGTVTLGTEKVLSPDTASISGTAGSVLSKEKTVTRPVK